ncbi:SpoIIE family protein phosphatase [candidate division KSB3 bacterium]|uniref:SpoIIE family protein phosphatase n=1 Tax=candidate division KSB3 bacterium TaxID=2044937 RepID=A0A9D5Q7W4_9BACT|nr:SpoIIE family protein phosphatase [candidate division KSB3 bacterium]MBD3327330.1 SpoIIE family protein phosphatase [candidate division KSB3 bacterium]
MNASISGVSHVLEVLGAEQVQQILHRLTSIIPFPVYVLTPEGEVLGRLKTEESCLPNIERFQVDPERHVVTGVSPAGCLPETLRAIPLELHKEVAGYMVAVLEPGDIEDEAATRRVRLVADLLAEKAYAEYELENLTEELIEKYNEVNLLYDISDALGAVLDPNKVCQIIIEKAVEVVGVEKASIMLYDSAQNCLYIAASHGIELTEEALREIRVAPGEGVSGRVFISGKHLIVENIEESSLPIDSHRERRYKKKSFISVPVREYKKKSFLSVPMVCSPKQTEKRVMGVMNMTDKRSSDMFTSGDLRLLTAIAMQAAMSLYNIQLIEEMKDIERMKKEMEIAQQIQQGLLPAAPPALPGIELAARCLPATQVGGDYYDFFLCADQKLGLVIADVSGHNVGAALMMAVARSTLRSEVLAQKSPARVLKDTNLMLYEDLTHAELFITMFYAEYDMHTKVLCYANGAHNPPILVRDGACIFLDTEGIFLGLWESADFEEHTLALQPNDLVIFYTDGVVEAMNEAREMFRVERLCDVAKAHTHSSASQVLQRIYAELVQHSGSATRSDDITVVVLKVH